MYVVRCCQKCKRPGRVISTSHVLGVPDPADGWFVESAGKVLDESELVKAGLARSDSVLVRYKTCSSCRLAGDEEMVRLRDEYIASDARAGSWRRRVEFRNFFN